MDSFPILDDEMSSTADAERFSAIQNSVTLMDRYYLSPNSFRGRVFQGFDECSAEPFKHRNVGEYLLSIGADKFWPMPEIIEPAEARKRTDRWRKIAQDAFQDFAPKALHFSDLFYHALKSMAPVDPPDEDYEMTQPDMKIQDLVAAAWSNVMEQDDFKELFQTDTLLVPESGGEGFKAWAKSFQHMSWHTWEKTTVNKETLETKVPVPVYDFTPTRLSSKEKEDILRRGGQVPRPDFSAYRRHCAENKLNYLIPWFNMEELSLPRNLANLLMSRAIFPPCLFGQPDFTSMQLGRVGRLLLPPYCDACFTNFDRPDHPWKDVNHARQPKFEDMAGVGNHAVFIENPSAREIRERHQWSQYRGNIFGWGEGFLVLQAQAIILSFCAEVTKLLVGLYVTDDDGNARADLVLQHQTPVFLPMHYNFPMRVNIPGLPPINKASFKAALQHYKSVYPPQLPPRTYGPWLAHTLHSNPSYVNAWVHFQVQMMRQCLSMNDIKVCRQPIDSLCFAQMTSVFNAHKTDIEELNEDLIPHVGKLHLSAKSFAETMSWFLSMHYGRIPGPVVRNGEQTKSVLRHFNSSDIKAKRALANDVIRRALRYYIFSLEVNFIWGFVVDHMRSLADSDMVFHAPLPVMRKLAEMAWELLRGQGLFHGLPEVAKSCERKTPGIVHGWELPAGLMTDPRPDRATFVGEGHDFGMFMKLVQFGPPSTSYGVPSMGLLLEKLMGEFDALHDCVKDKYHYSLISHRLDDLERMTNQISLLSRFNGSHIDHERAYLVMQPNIASEMLRDCQGWKFMTSEDKFPFERHINEGTLAALHSKVLGIRYANEPIVETTTEEADAIVAQFFEELDDWLLEDEDCMPVGYKVSMDEYRKQIAAAKEAREDGLGPEGIHHVNLDWGRRIKTMSPDFQDVMNVESPEQSRPYYDNDMDKDYNRQDVELSLFIADDFLAALNISTSSNPVIGEQSPVEASEDEEMPEAIRQDDEMPDDVPENEEMTDDIPQDEEMPDEILQGAQTPEQVPQDEEEDEEAQTTENKPSRPRHIPLAPLEENPNHKPKEKNSKNKRGGKKKKNGSGDADEDEDEEPVVLQRITGKFIDIAERLLRKGVDKGAVSDREVKLLFGRLGFSYEERAGSRVVFKRGRGVQFPKHRKNKSVVTHMPHGSSQAQNFNAFDLDKLRRSFEDSLITWETFNEYYVEPQERARANRANMVRVLGEGEDWSEMEEEEEEEEKEEEEEEEDTDDSAIEVPKTDRVNGNGKRGRDEEEEVLAAFWMKRARCRE